MLRQLLQQDPGHFNGLSNPLLVQIKPQQPSKHSTLESYKLLQGQLGHFFNLWANQESQEKDEGHAITILRASLRIGWCSKGLKQARTTMTLVLEVVAFILEEEGKRREDEDHFVINN